MCQTFRCVLGLSSIHKEECAGKTAETFCECSYMFANEAWAQANYKNCSSVAMHHSSYIADCTAGLLGFQDSL